MAALMIVPSVVYVIQKSNKYGLKQADHDADGTW